MEIDEQFCCVVSYIGSYNGDDDVVNDEERHWNFVFGSIQGF